MLLYIDSELNKFAKIAIDTAEVEMLEPPVEQSLSEFAVYCDKKK